MTILPFSYQKVAKGLNVWVSKHYLPILFGIRGKYESSYKSGQYIESGTPGTGFFVRSGGGRSYRNFCKAERAKLEPSYWKLLRGEEFSFDDEMRRAEKAAHNTKDRNTRLILESYQNVLPLAKDAEESSRIIEGIKAMGHRHHKLTSYQSHVVTSYKSRIARLEHDVREVQMNVPQMCGEEMYKKFANVVIMFTALASSHRIWHSSDNYKELDNSFGQVYFDLGIFNYIQAPLMTPMMRDIEGNLYFIYPDFIIKARDAVDFEVYDIDSLTFLFRPTHYDMIASQVLESYADSMDSDTTVHRRDYEQYGDGLLANKDTMTITEEEEKEQHHHEKMVGEFYIPEIKLRYYVRDIRAVKHFVDALNTYKDSRKTD